METLHSEGGRYFHHCSPQKLGFPYILYLHRDDLNLYYVCSVDTSQWSSLKSATVCQGDDGLGDFFLTLHSKHTHSL